MPRKDFRGQDLEIRIQMVIEKAIWTIGWDFLGKFGTLRASVWLVESESLCSAKMRVKRTH
jgi:hypothetical protein